MAGWYSEWVKTIFKGSGITRWKERIEVGRVERFAGRAQKLLEVDFPKLLEEEHKVTKWLKEFVQFVKDVEKAGHNAFQIIFNELTQTMTEEGEIDKIFDILDKYWNKIPTQARSRIKYSILKIVKEIENEENNERAEYKEGSAIINESAKFRNDREAFAAIMRTWFKSKASLKSVLERIAWRRNVAASRAGIIRTEAMAKELQTSLNKLKDVKRLGQVTEDIEQEIQLAAKYIASMFHESYLVKERAILMTFKLMYIAENADEFTKKDVNRHFAPERPTKETQDHLTEAVEKMGARFHDVIEQGFRISIKKLEAEERKGKKLASAA